MTTQTIAQPFTAEQAIADFDRRYQQLKDRFAELKAMRKLMGLPSVDASPISTSSRMMLRMIIVERKTHQPVAALASGSGQVQLDEVWFVNGEAVEA